MEVYSAAYDMFLAGGLDGLLSPFQLKPFNGSMFVCISLEKTPSSLLFSDPLRNLPQHQKKKKKEELGSCF